MLINKRNTVFETFKNHTCNGNLGLVIATVYSGCGWYSSDVKGTTEKKDVL